MNKAKKIFLLIPFLIFGISAQLYSQVNTDSLIFSGNTIRNNLFTNTFRKQLNTYDLQTKLNYNLKVNKFLFGIRENYLSSVVKSTTKNIKDEQFLSLFGEYNYSPLLQFGLLAQNSIYSNNRKIAINEASILHSTAYLKFSPIDQLLILPYGGFSINRQVGEDDRGEIYGANLTLDRYYIDQFLISSKLKYQSENIAPRKNTHQIANVAIQNNLDMDLTNIITANYSNVRKDFYFTADSSTSRLFDIEKNIQSRTEQKYIFEERLFNSRYSSDLVFDVRGNVSIRNIDRDTRYKDLNNISLSSFDTEINEFRFDLSGTVEYRSSIFYSKVRVDLSEREEKHKIKDLDGANSILVEQREAIEKRKNNTSDYTTISALTNFNLSKSDNLGISLLHRKLIYNTPSEENFDDRDEILSIFRISYVHQYNRFLNLFANLEGSLNHIVYIFAERSSNNNIRRIAKLNLGSEFKSSRIYSKNTFEVSANYTSYDFEEINPNLQSFSFRQFNVEDSTSIQVSNRLFLTLDAYVRLSEQGEFIWESFKNNPDRFLAEYYFLPKIEVKYGATNFGVGIRAFTLQTFGYDILGSRFLSTRYKSYGPVTNFRITTKNLELNLNGWYEFINTESNDNKELANLTFSLRWKL